MTEQIANVLFVCTGNICRSPFAERLFIKTAAQKGIGGFYADSAGLLALPGNSATQMAQKASIEYGVNLAYHKAKPLTEKLMNWADLILVMEKSQLDELDDAFPEASGKIKLIRSFARYGSKDRGVVDPYGLEYEAYRFCFLDIEDAVVGLVDRLVVPKKR
ncbi:hypothetical protein ACFL9U_07670 [Thermodesulfobacteriota bacterium]